ncbi:MAG: sulfatase-like hydrolase/transferase, partial [Rikenellaceae bacterium]
IPRGFEGRSEAKAYGDALQYADMSVGILMDMIKRLGIEENTIVVITSDNGPLIEKDLELEKCYGRFGETDPNRKHVLRGGKYQDKYDGGIRVPCIMNWKGKVPSGAVSNELIGSMDLFNLFADIAGADIPQNIVIDGKDVRPIIFGEKGAKSPHSAIFGFRAKGGLESVRFENWKLVINKNAEPSLYNLTNDLGESHDVASENKKVVQKMLDMGTNADKSIRTGTAIAY